MNQWKELAGEGGHPVLSALIGLDLTDVATLTRLRREFSSELLMVAMELTRAREKARFKFPHSDRLMVDVEGVEQATSWRVAVHKAARFAEIGVKSVLDLCCGIGGDAMALGKISDVLAVDHNPLRAWMAGQNAGCAVEVADAVERLSTDQPFHIDPDRRIDGRRRHDYQDYRPGLSDIARLLDGGADGAVKLVPGVDLSELPLDGTRELEFINDGGVLVQAVLWSNRLAFHPGMRTATRLPSGECISGPFAPPPSPVHSRVSPPSFLYVPDPALERAGISGQVAEPLGLSELHGGLGLLCGDDEVSSAWLRGYRVLRFLPWREKKIRQCLRELDSGVVEVKTRGGAVNATEAQVSLRGSGQESHTVFGLRLGKSVVAIVTKPLVDPAK